MTFSIRRARPTDAERIARIHAETWRAAYPFIPADFLENKARLEPRRKLWNELLSHSGESGQTHFVGEAEGKIVGFFSIGPPRDGDLPKNLLELAGIYFDAAYWRRGYGTQAMRFVLEQAKRRGCPEVLLWVFRENAAAIAFYETFGFRFDGTAKDLPLGRPVTECRYRLRLRE